MSRIFRFLILILLFSGCREQIDGIDAFLEGEQIPVYRKNLRPEKYPSLDFGEKRNYYYFDEPLPTNTAETYNQNNAYEIEYRSTREIPFVLFLEDEIVRQFILPDSAGRFQRFQIPVDPHTGCIGFSFDAEQESLVFSMVSLEPVIGAPGVIVDDVTGRRSLGLGVEPLGDNEFQFSYAGDITGGLYCFLMIYSYQGAGDETIRLNIGNVRKRTPLQLNLRTGTIPLFIYYNSLDELPDSLFLDTIPKEFRINALFHGSIEELAESPYITEAGVSLDWDSSRNSPVPLPLDIGSILHYPRDRFRNPDYELFSWSLHRNILIFDFDSYKAQSRYLKRLAFFTEKPGYVGTIPSIAELAGLHGWNAHDYRPEDLAAFFSLAEETAVELSGEEIELRTVLIDNGIITLGSKGYLPGSGAIISISRESSQSLRNLFITHEATHGFYFTSEEYRKGCEDVWNSLDQEEREFWREFMEYRTYDRNNEDLMINEFQAYHLQYPVSAMKWYFRESALPRFAANVPAKAPYITAFLESYPDTFTRASARLSDMVLELFGVTAGDFSCLNPVE